MKREKRTGELQEENQVRNTRVGRGERLTPWFFSRSEGEDPGERPEIAS